jgi:hypothetical protein
MTRVTIDSATQAKLQGDQPLVLCNEAGKVLGYFHPAIPAGSIKSPISDEEIERLSQQRTGSPLSEVLKRIGAA